MIYAIRQVDGALVKIGHTGGDVRSRYLAIRTMSPVPLELIGQWPGDAETERRLHEQFAGRRRHGEWFDFGDTDPTEAITSAAGTTSTLAEVAPPRPWPGRRPRRRAESQVAECLDRPRVYYSDLPRVPDDWCGPTVVVHCLGDSAMTRVRVTPAVARELISRRS